METIRNTFNKISNSTITSANNISSHQLVAGSQQIVDITLPLISTYKPDLGRKAYRLLQGLSITQLLTSMIYNKDFSNKNLYTLSKQFIQISFSHLQKGVILRIIIDLIETVYQCTQTSQNRLMKLSQILVDSLQILALLRRRSLPLQIASLGAQGLFGLYQTYCLAKDIYQKESLMSEKTPRAILALAFSLIKLRQTLGLLKFYHRSNQDPLAHIIKAIDKKKILLTHPVTQKTRDLGYWVQGYGKGIVKWGNLCFFNKSREDGFEEITLLVRINKLYWDRIKIISSSINELSETEKQDLLPFLGCKQLKVIDSIDLSMSVPDHLKDIQPDPCYDLGNGQTVYVGTFPKHYLSTNPDTGRDLLSSHQLDILREHLAISVRAEDGIVAIRKALSVFGLDDILTPCSEKDFERMKLGFIFKTFFPQHSDILQKEQEFFDSSPQDLKAKMEQIAPEMPIYLEKYPVTFVDVFPGYARPSIPLSQSLKDIGVRGLTAAYSRSSYPVDYSGLTDIVKNGLLSCKLRRLGSIEGQARQNALGINYIAGGMDSVFTQMVHEYEVEAKMKLEDFGYSVNDTVRLFFSNTVLNRGSYQHLSAVYGTKTGPIYEKRQNIFDFITQFPWITCYEEMLKQDEISYDQLYEHRHYHEIMTPDRILPQEIRAIHICSDSEAKKLKNHFKNANMTYCDSAGHERLITNDIPLDEFVVSGDHLEENMIKNLSPTE